MINNHLNAAPEFVLFCLGSMSFFFVIRSLFFRSDGKKVLERSVIRVLKFISFLIIFKIYKDRYLNAFVNPGNNF